jgi:ABC-type lipoprotein export system ATPase subunit
MLRLTGLHQRYGTREVLTLRHFEAAAGDHWLVLGASGSGKTTLLNLLAGLLRPSEGTVEIGGQVLGALGGAALDRWRGRHIGIVPQKLHLVSSLSVIDNLLLAPYLAGLPVDESRAFGLLGNLSLREQAKSKPHQLSHGQAQAAAGRRTDLQPG